MSFFITAIAVAADAMTVATIATAVAETGIALEVVGHITGSQTLEKVGGVMALAGGITGLADSAFSAVSLGSTATDASTALDATGNIDGTALLPDASSTGADVGTQAAGQVGGDTSGLTGSSAANAPAGLNDTTGLTNPDGTPVNAGGQAPNQITGNPTGAPSPLSSPTQGNGLNATGSSVTPDASSTTPTGAPSPTSPASTSAGQSTSGAGQTTSGAGSTLNSGAGSTAAQLNNQSTSSMIGENANSTAPGTLIAGQPAPAPTYNGFSGTLNGNQVAQNSSQVYDAYNSANKPGLLDNITSWVGKNPNLTGQLISGAMSGLGNSYAASKSYELGTNQLALQQQIQANKSAQVGQDGSTGIINRARTKKV